MDNLEKAKSIVRQFLNPSINDESLDYQLDISKGLKNNKVFYRPYYCAAFFTWSSYQRITKADEISWEYDKDKFFTIQGMLTMQKNLDVGAIIPAGFSSEDLLAATGTDNNSNSGIGIMVI